MDDKLVLKNILHGAGKAPAEPDLPLADEADEVPQDVGPCGWVWPKGCRALDVERGGKEPVVSFQFVYLGVRSEFTPTKFWVIFVGVDSWKVTVEGHNLRALYYRIQDHGLRRIRRVGRDFGPDDGKPVVTKIEVTDETPRDRE